MKWIGTLIMDLQEKKGKNIPDFRKKLLIKENWSLKNVPHVFYVAKTED